MRGCEDASTRGDALDGEAVVDVVRSQQTDAAMVMLAVVPVEEWPAVRAVPPLSARYFGNLHVHYDVVTL